MAAKFVIFSLAVVSASAGCLPSFQEEFSFGQCGEVAVEAPKVELVQAAPKVELVPAQRVEYVQAPKVEYVQAPKVEYVQAAPKVEFVPAAPKVEIVQAPRVEYVQAAPKVELVQAAPAIEVAAPVVASTGPQVSSRALPVVQAPGVTLNAVESPIIRLPSPPVPGPKVIRHQCFCTKTVVKPQIVQRTVTVPRIQRYLKQTYKPIVENLSYQARPIGSDFRGEDIIISGSSAPVAQEVAIPVPVRAPEVAIPVPVRAPVNIGLIQEAGECQCQCY